MSSLPRRFAEDPSELEASPYRVRGALYLGTRTYFDSKVPGGYAALLDALRPPLREFMAQRFEPSTFYEVMVVPELIDVEARVCGLTIARYLDQRTGFQAARDLGGMMMGVLRLLPTPLVISRVAAVMTDTFNFGESDLTKVADCHYQVKIKDVPQRLCAWLEHSVGVYGQASLEASGVRGIEVRALPPLRKERASRVDLLADVRWKR